jgi:dienelactone hydrolase
VENLPEVEYDRGVLDVREVARGTEDGVLERLITFGTPYGYRRAAELIGPAEGDPLGAILYVHWYEPEARDSNRSQFHDEAMQLARRGAVSLLVETMWSDRDFFIKRTQADDFAASLRQVVELRLALDLLLAQPGVDGSRLAYVGHDFGGMYGVLAGAADRRPTHYVIMAATPRFHEWYLYYPKLEGEPRERFVEQMAPLDPIANVAALAPAPLLFQFARSDRHVPIERAEAFFATASEPKELRWYEAGHGLNQQATVERIAWLSEQLVLKSERPTQ